MDGSPPLTLPPPYRARLSSSSPRSRVQAAVRRYRALLLLVVLPTLLSGIYYFGFAADQYQSEAQFVIYSSHGGESQLGGLGQMLGLDADGGSQSSETFSVIAYMESHDGIEALDRQFNLTNIFRAPQADYVSRLWFSHPSAEQLLKYYDRKVVVTYQQDTTITTLDVHAFTASDAYNLANALLVLGEQQVNAYNDRITADTVKVASNEVAVGQAQIEQAENAITKFRQKHGDLNPELSGVSDMTLIASLKAQLTGAEAQMAQTQGLRADSPQIQALRGRIAALNQQISAQNTNLTGTSGALAPVLADYQDLALQLQFAQQSYTAAQLALEAAHEDALKQQLFLVRVVQPNFPQTGLFPRRLLIVSTIFVTLLIAFGIGSLLVAGVREHAI